MPLGPVESYAGMVDGNLAPWRHRVNPELLEELYQEGWLALCELWNNYDESRGATFNTYAWPRIGNRMSDYVRSHGQVVRTQRRKPKWDENPDRETLNGYFRPEIIELKEGIHPSSKDEEEALMNMYMFSEMLDYVKKALNKKELTVLAHLLEKKPTMETAAELGVSRRAVVEARRKVKTKCAMRIRQWRFICDAPTI